MSGRWLETSENQRHVEALRRAISDDAGVVTFVGAGVSFGASRLGRRRYFDKPGGAHDGYPFPDWSTLIERMRKRLCELPELADRTSQVDDFFESHIALDCAELFEQYMGSANTYQFLRQQFTDDYANLTPTHEELARLPVRDLFTTNYDTLLEDALKAYKLVVSATPGEFSSNRNLGHERHLIKLHGTIDKADSIVLTRTQYARSRAERVEMFRYLEQAVRGKTFLYLGYSLSDPDFTQLYDEMRLALGANVPPGFVVQGRPNPVRDQYLRALDLNSVVLDEWGQMPELLAAINPM